MSILVDEDTAVIVQGITGRLGAEHTARMLAFGTRVVAGTRPGKGGQRVHDVPVFDTVKEAVRHGGATASVIMVPPPFAADAIMEAADGGIRLAVAITDGIPAQDMIRVKRYMRRYRSDRSMRLMGPNSPGVISPGRALLGVMPAEVHRVGRVGIITRSGTLGYEAAAQLDALGIGISSSVGIGGGPISGSTFLDVLPLFEADPDTDLVLLIDESGSARETELVELIADGTRKTIVAWTGSRGLRHERVAGQAGALMSAVDEPERAMEELLRAAGAVLVPSAERIGETVAAALGRDPSGG